MRRFFRASGGKFVRIAAYNICMKKLSAKHRILLACGAVAAALAFTVGMCVYALARTASGISRMTIVIDAGHGGIDGGTVGVTTGITPGLSGFSHIFLICMMFLGRVGIMSFSVAFLARSRAAKLKYPTVEFMVG